MEGEDGYIVGWYPGIDNALPLHNGNSTGAGRYNVPPLLTDSVALDYQQHRHQRHRRREDVKTVVTTDADSRAESTIHPGEYSDNEGIQHSSDDGTERRKTKKSGSSMFLDFSETAGSDVHRQSVLCSRRRLVVDAVDLGLNERIIFPRQFQADYCAGSCPFPPTKVHCH